MGLNMPALLSPRDDSVRLGEELRSLRLYVVGQKTYAGKDYLTNVGLAGRLTQIMNDLTLSGDKIRASLIFILDHFSGGPQRINPMFHEYLLRGSLHFPIILEDN